MDLRFYPIIDHQFTQGEKAIKLAKKILAGGAKILQYRNKESSDKEFEKTARKLLKVCRKHHVPLIINDRLEVARRINADGVHLGYNDLKTQNFQPKADPPLEEKLKTTTQNSKLANRIKNYLGSNNKIIGLTARTLQEAKWAEKQGTDYIGCSAVYLTPTKTDAPEIGLSGLKKMVESVKIPTVAIGGLNEKNLKEVLKTGVTGVAMVSAVCCVPDPEKTTRKILKTTEKYQ